LGTTAGFATNISFNANSNQMQAMVYSPDAGATFRLKAEDKTDPTKSVETDAVVTTANAWQVLTFNFANHAAGTTPINYAINYNKLSIFPNFGVAGATAGAKTYFVGTVAFGTISSVSSKFDNNAFSVFPNPANGIIEITTYMKDKGTIEIVDLLGKVVYNSSVSFTGSTTKVDISNVENGIYLLKIISGGKTAVKRISVNK